MSLEFIIWLFAFLLQAAMLGRTMFALISLSDLENDFINPYDLTLRLNRFVALEYVGQVLITASLLLTGKWFIGVLQLGMLGFLLHNWSTRRHVVDATDVFRQLPVQKKRRLIMFGSFLLYFIIITYRLIESVIHGLLTDEGRANAKRLFQDAAATLHGY
ncbi:hypothetical protein VOLCADRAFT_76026 [Volvox carteri f. nagariensis]|uniref:Cornichon-like protein n=1 Tax=Volvox carteri f. nagariensis TaxID=3068 RepID=D8U5G5_VOLCA|nr:uncharacterized protein VOLCADRAFT_76026 [Volvox carteri f. nagariensis]EFJ44997.1 hypothetical protein VOLCADRAFT_76026 [Volvox carteri f. nagariensis]|eukprot:XP_002953968.1 hypothetical protein VOLCADRAFT_76026 [Volvox carteri f. nagariensis]